MQTTVDDLLAAAGIEIRSGNHRHVRSGWIGVDCPFCDDVPGSFHLGIDSERQYSYCWRCGYHPLVETLVRLTGLDRREIFSAVGNRRRVAAPTENRIGRLRIPKGIGPLEKPHRRYLRGRGLDPDEVADVWGVGGIGLHSHLAWRLFIPVRRDGRTVTWTTRSIADRGRRYVSASVEKSDVPIKNTLYGEDLAGHAVVVVEGPVDAWRIGPGAVALYGTVWTREQFRRLTRYPVRTVLLDRSATREAKRLCEELSAFPGRTELLELETGTDPADADEPEIAEVRRKIFAENRPEST